MVITICGSLKHFKKMVAVKKELLSLGFKVSLPNNSELFLKKDGFDKTTSIKRKNGYIKRHLKKIKHSDAVLIVNEEKNGVKGYIGGNTFLEMGFAFVLKKPIFILNNIPHMQYTDEISGMLPIVLNGNLKKIK